MDLRIAAEAAELLTRRHAEDGLVQMEYFEHQRKFLQSEKAEVNLFGANRSGKTEALAAAGASMLRFGDPNPKVGLAGGGSIQVYDRSVRVWGISLTHDMSRNILQPKMFNNGARIDSRPPMIPDSEIASWNISNQTLRLKNGSMCVFKSCDGGRDHFQGADIDLAMFDEVPPEEVYNEVTLRIGGGRRLLIRLAATILPPAGVPGGVSWMFLSRVQPWLAKGATTEERNAQSPRVDIFTAGMRDNPTILPEEIARLAETFSPDSPEYLIRVEGHLLPSIGGALCYGRFNQGYHVVRSLQTEEGRPVVVPHLPLCLCVDFNAENGVWTVGQRVGRTFKVVDEIHMERSDIASMTHEFRTRYPVHEAEVWVYGDASGRRREGQTGLSSFHLIGQYMTGYPVPLRFQIPEINPPVRDRVDAVNLQITPPTGERLFEISPRCEETIKDLVGTKWNTRLQIDKRHGRRSDGMDGVGYWIHHECPPHGELRPQKKVRSIKSPRYGPFPAARHKPVMIGNQWYYGR